MLALAVVMSAKVRVFRTCGGLEAVGDLEVMALTIRCCSVVAYAFAVRRLPLKRAERAVG